MDECDCREVAGCCKFTLGRFINWSRGRSQAVFGGGWHLAEPISWRWFRPRGNRRRTPIYTEERWFPASSYQEVLPDRVADFERGGWFSQLIRSYSRGSVLKLLSSYG
jgi:hypothetical protein